MGEQNPGAAWGAEESRVAKTFNPFSISGVSHMSKAGLCGGAGRIQTQPPQAAGPTLASAGHEGTFGGTFHGLVEI